MGSFSHYRFMQKLRRNALLLYATTRWHDDTSTAKKTKNCVVDKNVQKGTVNRHKNHEGFIQSHNGSSKQTSIDASTALFLLVQLIFWKMEHAVLKRDFSNHPDLRTTPEKDSLAPPARPRLWVFLCLRRESADGISCREYQQHLQQRDMVFEYRYPAGTSRQSMEPAYAIFVTPMKNQSYKSYEALLSQRVEKPMYSSCITRKRKFQFIYSDHNSCNETLEQTWHFQ